MNVHQQRDVTFTVNGTSYTLVHNLFAWAVAQRALSRPGFVPKLDDIRRNIGDESAIDIIATFFGMLQAKHPQFSTLEQASALLEQAGPAGVTACLQAMGVAVPDPADLAELQEVADRAHPPAAQATTTRRAGTGGRKSSKPGTSA